MITSRPDTPLAGELAPVWPPNCVPQHYLRRYSAATCGVASHRLQRSGIATRLAASLVVGHDPAGCGRRKVEPAWAGFFAAFGFLASRLLRLRPLAKTILLVLHTPLI